MSIVGVFDSGIGGLSILNEALIQAPQHHYLYLADSANAPYGEKSSDWVSDRSLKLCSWLVDQGAQSVVVACNTATAQAIARIREKYPNIPIIGVEPGIKPASNLSKTKVVGVLATQSTLNSEKFKLLLSSLTQDCEFIQQAGNGLVPLIEQGILNGEELSQLLHQYIDPMILMGADTLVLGCTHYPFLQATINKLFGDQLQIIDTSQAVVRQLNRFIKYEELINSGSVDLYSTLNGDSLLQLAKKLLSQHFQKPALAYTVSI